jgi:hypothetical protein
VTFFFTVLLLRLADPIVIGAGLVPYFGIRNAPWRSVASAAAAGAFIGVVYDAGAVFSPIAFASSLLATAVAACLWWSVVHFGQKIAKGRGREKREESRKPRLVHDDDDWRR